MKKTALCFAALFAASVCFTQSVRTADWYIEAVNLTKKAIEQQETGYYEDSLTTAKEANTALDAALLNAHQALMQAQTASVQKSADSVIDTARKSGSATDAQFKQPFDDAVIRYQKTLELLPAAAEIKTDEDAISQAYTPIIGEFTAVKDTVTQINNSFFTREQQKATALITAVKSRYTDMVNKKALIKNSPDETKITGAINSADAALQQNNYAGVAENVKTAHDLLTAADNTFVTQQAATKKALDEANTRFNQLKNTKIIATASAEDKNISGLLATATTAYTGGTFAAAQQSITDANNAMTAADNAYKTAQTTAQKAITDASAKQKQLNDSGIMRADSTDNAAVSKLIADATAAFTANDSTKALNDANSAISSMTAIEQNYTALMNSVQQLIAQAKSGQTQLGTQYPDAKGQAKYAAITSDIAAADAGFTAKTFVPAQQSAQAALDKIAAFKTELDALAAKTKADAESRAALYTADGKYKILPQFYTVIGRVPLSTTDCLWRISQYSFIYGNKDQWRPIYELNKNKFPRPENPNLIYPGQVLEIPSVNGEKRDGMYDPKVNYIDFADAVNNTTRE